MRRAPGEGSVYRRKDGRWVAGRTVGVTAAGNSRRIACYGRTQREARAKLARRIEELGGELALGFAPKPDAVKLGEWMQAWVSRQEARRDLKAPSKERYGQLVRSYILDTPEASKPVQKIASSDVENILDAVALERSRSVADGVRMVLKMALNLAVEKRIVPFNVAANVQLNVKKEARKPNSFTPAEVQAMVAASKDEATRALLIVALTTGLRKGELIAMRWQEVDLDAGTLEVIRNATARGEIVAPKTERSYRTLTLPVDAVDALKKHRAAQWRELNLLEQFGRPVNRNRVWTTENGLATRSATLDRVFKAARDAVGARPLWFHCMRHTHATLSLRAGVPVHVVSARLGHASPVITLGVYSHVLQEMEQAAALSISDLAAVGKLSKSV